DSNFSTPDLGLHLGMYTFPHTLQDVLKNDIPIDKAIYSHPSGVEILPSSLSFGEVDVDIRGLKNYLQDLTDYEYIFIDSPPGLGREILPILDICDELLIVTNPEIPAITDGLRAVEISKRENVPILGIVLNKIRGEKYELSVSEIGSIFDFPLVATIPEDAKVRESVALGNPVALNHPYSPAAVEFAKFGGYLVGEEYQIGFFAKLMNWLENIKRKVSLKGEIQIKAMERPVAIEARPIKKRTKRSINYEVLSWQELRELARKRDIKASGKGVTRQMIEDELIKQDAGVRREPMEIEEVSEEEIEVGYPKYLHAPYKTKPPQELEGMKVNVIMGIKGAYEEKLVKAGYKTVGDLASASITEVASETGLREPYAEYLISAAKAIVESTD
ncbi:MAG: P-loop NTPase, partial [Candidatus Hydrothermarchaeales archaeon]